jgi:hypothetical protein
MTERIRFSWFQVPELFHCSHGSDVCTSGHIFRYVCNIMVKYINLICQCINKAVANKHRCRGGENIHRQKECCGQGTNHSDAIVP